MCKASLTVIKYLSPHPEGTLEVNRVPCMGEGILLGGKQWRVISVTTDLDSPLQPVTVHIVPHDGRIV